MSSPLYKENCSDEDIAKTNQLLGESFYSIMVDYYAMVVNDEIRKKEMLKVLRNEVFLTVEENAQNNLKLEKTGLMIALKKY
jgi:hypothetical protein